MRSLSTKYFALVIAIAVSASALGDRCVCVAEAQCTDGGTQRSAGMVFEPCSIAKLESRSKSELCLGARVFSCEYSEEKPEPKDRELTGLVSRYSFTFACLTKSGAKLRMKGDDYSMSAQLAGQDLTGSCEVKPDIEAVPPMVARGIDEPTKAQTELDIHAAGGAKKGSAHESVPSPRPSSQLLIP